MDLDHERRLTEVEKRQNNIEDLVGTVKVLADREKRVEGDVKEIKSDVKDLKQKPAKRWELAVTEMIKLLVAVVGGFLLAKAGL